MSKNTRSGWQDKNPGHTGLDRTLLPDAGNFYSNNIRKLKKGRAGWATGLCPFHNEKNPSFSVNLQSGGFHCHGCGKSGGDIIAFVMLLQEMNFITACRHLGAWRENS